jgi:hypothetical protein
VGEFAELFQETAKLPILEQDTYVSGRLRELLALNSVRMWTIGEDIPVVPTWMLIGIATWSLPDLGLLDLVCERRTKKRTLEIAVSDMSHYSMRDINRCIPGIGKVFHTPILGIWRASLLTKSASGFAARQSIREYFSPNREPPL